MSGSMACILYIRARFDMLVSSLLVPPLPLRHHHRRIQPAAVNEPRPVLPNAPGDGPRDAGVLVCRDRLHIISPAR